RGSSPLLLRVERIDGLHVAERFIRRPRQREVLDEHVALADLEGLGVEVLVHAALVQRVRVEESGLRVERGVRPVLAVPRRRPVLGGLHVAEMLLAISVSTGRPVSLSTWLAQLTFSNAFAASSLPLVR